MMKSGGCSGCSRVVGVATSYDCALFVVSAEVYLVPWTACDISSLLLVTEIYELMRFIYKRRR